MPLSAWTQTVTGVVLDDKTELPIIGVTIQEASTDRGTITDVDGRFTITLEKPDPVLIFRYTGYTAVELKLDGRTELEVKMTEAAFLIDEIVVVGYGIQKKSDLTGAVSTVKGRIWPV